jgi:DNA-binding response OmpR family regulator
VDVVFVRWPQESERRDRLAQAEVPRVLLVDAAARAPDPVDCLEDWVRLPADDDDVRLRASAVARRASLHIDLVPDLDDDGVLRVGPRWTPLPPVEARLTEALLARFGAVVSREALGRAGWPEGAPGRNALDVHVLRLRRRLAPVGLGIRTVRSRGYLLESESRQPAVRQA